MNKQIVSPEEFSRVAAEWIVTRVATTLAQRENCSLCLAGGGTPRGVYEELARDEVLPQIPWARVRIYFGDERCVAPDHPDSNFRMARETLLRHIPLTKHSVFMMDGGETDYDSAARAYEECLPEQFDILLLGIGEDGHTASLFPGQAVLHETTRRICAVIGSKPPPQRLTITPPVIEAAHETLVLIAGAGKRDILRTVQTAEATPLQYPVLFARAGTWLVDTAAAG